MNERALPSRRSLRLRGYDYSQAGAYFVTICADERMCLFGSVVGARMQLSEWGSIVQAHWHDLSSRYPSIDLDAFVVMPDHIHGIIVLNDHPAHTTVPIGNGHPTHTTVPDGRDGACPIRPPTLNPVRPPTLSEIIGAYKSLSTRAINAQRGTPGARIWQRGFYEHVIRNEVALAKIREYIGNNPMQWALDHGNPAH